jgi:hypothetical protein
VTVKKKKIRNEQYLAHCSTIHPFIIFYSSASLNSSFPLFLPRAIFRPKHRFNQVSQPNLPISPPLKPPYHTQASACSSRSSAARSSVSDLEEEEEELDEDKFRFASESVFEMERVSMVVVVSIYNVGGCACHWVIVGEIVD